MTILPATADEFTADLFAAFATIDRGGVLWTAHVPCPADWYTGDAATDLNRVVDLLCEADSALIGVAMTGDAASIDQARAHVAALSDLCDYLASVVETAAQARQ